MIYLWRSENYRGIATALTEKELFWKIDHYIDPFCVEIKKTKHINLSFYVDKLPFEDQEYSFLEMDIFDFWEEDKWIKPKWKNYGAKK